MTVNIEGQAKTAVETLAVFCIYAVDFAINAGNFIISPGPRMFFS